MSATKSPINIFAFYVMRPHCVRSSNPPANCGKIEGWYKRKDAGLKENATIIYFSAIKACF